MSTQAVRELPGASATTLEAARPAADTLPPVKVRTLAEVQAPLRRWAPLAAIAPETAERLLAQFEIISVERRTVLFVAGELAQHLTVVLSGIVKQTVAAPDERELMVALLGPSDQCGDLPASGTRLHSTTAVAVTEVRLAQLPLAALARWLPAHPEFSTALLGLALQRLHAARTNLAAMAYRNVSERIADALLRLARQFGLARGGEILVRHELTQTELGQLVGTSRETVSKVLGNFAARGWIYVEPGCIVLIDPARIARRAGRANPFRAETAALAVTR